MKDPAGAGCRPGVTMGSGQRPLPWVKGESTQGAAWALSPVTGANHRAGTDSRALVYLRRCVLATALGLSLEEEALLPGLGSACASHPTAARSGVESGSVSRWFCTLLQCRDPSDCGECVEGRQGTGRGVEGGGGGAAFSCQLLRRGHLFRAAAGRAVSTTECNACHHSVLLRLCISSSASGVGAWGRGFSGTRAECSVRVPAAWQAADVAQGVSPCLRAGRPRRCSLLLAHTDLALTAGEFGMELGLLGWGVGLSHGAGRGSGPGTRGGTLLSRGLRRRSCRGRPTNTKLIPCNSIGTS